MKLCKSDLDNKVKLLCEILTRVKVNNMASYVVNFGREYSMSLKKIRGGRSLQYIINEVRK
jgi:hypothetical protein